MPVPNKKIRVEYLIGSLDTGGAEGQLLNLLRHLDRSRFDPHLALFNHDTAVRSEGSVTEVFSLGIPSNGHSRWRVKGWAAARALNRYRCYLKSARPDVVHAFLPASCILGCPAARLAGVPVVIGSRRSLVNAYRPGKKVAAVADRLSSRFADFMLGNSEAVTSEIVELDHFPPEHTATIYNGVDTARFHPKMDRALRKEMGWSEEHVVFGMVANFIPYKRHIDFVRAAASIRANFPQAKFVMAGHDRGALPGIMAEINNLKLRDSVTVVPGIQQPEKLYAAIDVYVCTSSTEGFSNVLLEAIACGKPIIATDVGGNRELVCHQSTGFLIPSRSIQAIADAAEILITDSDLRLIMGARGRKNVEENFSLNKMVSMHEALYLRLVRKICCQQN